MTDRDANIAMDSQRKCGFCGHREIPLDNNTEQEDLDEPGGQMVAATCDRVGETSTQLRLCA